MGNWISFGLLVICLALIAAVLVGRVYESGNVNRIKKMLIASAATQNTDGVDFDSFSELPPPVNRYFKHVLADGQKLINIVKMRQSGSLLTSMNTNVWSRFTANQIVVPPTIDFVWNAKIKMPLCTHISVLDSYSNGVGVGKVSLLSAFNIASDANTTEINSAALLRYLAEAVWYPTALLPTAGVVWSPIDDLSAMATLTDSGVTVALEFRFNEADEVETIYSSGRFARIDNAYKKLPWEGHFSDYQVRDGLRVPNYGEVGWYEDDTLTLVWKGNLIDVQYNFGL